MQKIFLSDAGPKVSQAIYGFYRWSESFATEANMERIINLCLDLGINTFDHADTYGGYQCEELFGKVIARKQVRREDLILFTKCGVNIPHPQRPEYRVPHYDTSADHIVRSVNNSLRKLGTDYIDIFLLNKLDPLSNIDETVFALQNLKSSGKIKNIGVINFTVFQHQLLSSRLKVPIVTNHVELNLLNTEALNNGQIDYMKQCYMKPLAMSPLAEGKISTGEDFKSAMLRKKLNEMSEKYGANLESLAVAWILKLDALPLIGTTEEDRIRNIARAFEIDLDRQDWYELYELSTNKNIL